MKDDIIRIVKLVLNAPGSGMLSTEELAALIADAVLEIYAVH